jgi:four helix bundle protein
LLVCRKSIDAANAVSAILARPAFGRDFKLREQLGGSSSRVAALIAEGFEQKSDRHFAHDLYLARGSAKETKAHLVVARMSSGLIQHLEREDRPHRRSPRLTDDSTVD